MRFSIALLPGRFREPQTLLLGLFGGAGVFSLAPQGRQIRRFYDIMLPETSRLQLRFYRALEHVVLSAVRVVHDQALARHRRFSSQPDATSVIRRLISSSEEAAAVFDIFMRIFFDCYLRLPPITNRVDDSYQS